MTDDDTLTVTVTLATPPVWYEPDFWNTHEFDSFDSAGPYANKPKVTVTTRYGETLAEVIDRAADGLGLQLGPAHEKYLRDRVSQWLARMGFYRPEDDGGFEVQRMYGWPYLLPIAKESGQVEKLPWRDVTYRQLLASSSLGLIEGDVLRPYISGSMPQGGAHEVVETAKVTADAIRHAYALLPQTQSAVDNAMRFAFLAGTVKTFHSWRKKRAERHADKKRLSEAVAEARSCGYQLVVEKYDWKNADDSWLYYAQAAKFSDEVDPIFLGNGLTPGFAAREGVKNLKRRIEEERAAGQAEKSPDDPA